ncbi:DctP family TRAP transporter solute-binding subunit [Clostridium sp. DL1XJH146]
MLKKFVSILCSVVLVGAVFTGCGGNNDNVANSNANNGETQLEDVSLKMSVTTSDSSTWTKGAEKFAELVSEKTDGRVTVKVYPNEQLSGGNQSKGVEMLRDGAIDLSFHSNIIYSVMDEKYGVISLPWLFPDFETADAKLSGDGGTMINDLLLESNIVGLGFGENGFRQITNSKQAITSPDDIAGLKIRIPGIKMYISLFQALGADPTAMNFSEVFTSLQQKAIDGQENPTDVIYSAKLYEVQEYISLWNYSYDALILGMNQDKFNSLDEAAQTAIKEAADEACEYQRELNRSNGEEQVEFFAENGMEVSELTEEEVSVFKELVQPIYDEYEPIVGSDLLKAFQ